MSTKTKDTKLEEKQEEKLEWFTAANSVKISGHLKSEWAKYGYDLNWVAGYKRFAPAELVAKTGVSLTVVTPDQPERRLVNSPKYDRAAAHRNAFAALVKQYATEKRVRVIAKARWSDGDLMPEFTAARILPVEWQKKEIRAIPLSLFGKLKTRWGGTFSNKPEDLAPFEGPLQAKFEYLRKQYMEQHFPKVTNA